MRAGLGTRQNSATATTLTCKSEHDCVALDCGRYKRVRHHGTFVEEPERGWVYKLEHLGGSTLSRIDKERHRIQVAGEESKRRDREIAAKRRQIISELLPLLRRELRQARGGWRIRVGANLKESRIWLFAARRWSSKAAFWSWPAIYGDDVSEMDDEEIAALKERITAEFARSVADELLRH